ncbi:hypothetical protein [Micromonospora chersina]|uniref:Uncharacterized protein n=1 Tax=Micromonospora chersina TaxID=47854 RepID=A0A1C6VYX6_9ACTN|nr:hypothetical protein [Micromonospora chersina]SCL71539.1 hypothetical protein GA0070603_5971 [Micromonospora chersina]
MFNNMWAGAWLLTGLIGSVLLRGGLWLLTLLIVAPLLGPAHMLISDANVDTPIWYGDIVASFLCAIATGVACVGIRRDRGWAYRLGRGLARFYVAVNAVSAAACGVLLVQAETSAWDPPLVVLVGFPFVLYVLSIVVAVLALRQLRTPRPYPEHGRSEPEAVWDT